MCQRGRGDEDGDKGLTTLGTVRSIGILIIKQLPELLPEYRSFICLLSNGITREQASPGHDAIFRDSSGFEPLEIRIFMCKNGFKQ